MCIYYSLYSFIFKSFISFRANTFVTEQAKYSYESSWNKKKTVKTYSKSRPHLVKTQSPDIFDDVFEEEGGVEGIFCWFYFTPT